jgi:hypothetical protein
MVDDDDFVLGEPETGEPGKQTESDSGVLVAGAADPTLLSFTRDGSRVVVGFNSTDVPDEVCVAAYRTQLLKFVQESECTVLTFDLTGIKILPSGMLGLLVTLKKRGLEIELLNPIADIVEVLRITKLNSLFKVR